jgi:phosphatidylglycerophosphatase A
MQKINKMIVSIATLGRLGYAPAPGTMGTLAALPVAYAISCFAIALQAGIIIALFFVSYGVIKKALPCFTTSDPSQIIVDEVVGCLVTFFALPFSWPVLILGFLLFRLFDIFKPCGIKRVEKLPGAWGVLLDDVVAGLFANLILRYLFL